MGAIGKLLRRENVQVVDSCANWEDSVRVAVRPMVETGYVTVGYIEDIINNVHKFGPYICLVPDFALLHASSDTGDVLGTQLGVTVLRRGVEFRPGEPVRVLVTLAATDGSSHIAAMGELANMLSDATYVEKVANAADADEVYGLLVNL